MKILSRQPIIMIAIVNASVALIAFFKDIILAAFIGTSIYADALTLAFFIPDSIGNNMIAAALSVACVPVFSRLIAREQTGKLNATVRTIMIYFVGLSGLLVILGFIFSSTVVGWLGVDAHRSDLAEATLPLLRILLPTIILFVIIAIGSAILQAQQRFIPPSMAPLLFNLFFLGGVFSCIVLGISVEKGIINIAIAMLLGIMVMTFWIGWSWYKSTTKLTASNEINTIVSNDEIYKGWKDILALFLPYMIIVFSMQAVFFAERYLLTYLDTGSVAALNYAFRLTQFPIWVFVAAVSVVILPSLSKHLALEQYHDVEKVMLHAFRSVILIICPAMLFLFVLREPIIIALFQRGAFDQHSVILTSGILEGYSLSILSQAFSLICVRYFLAIRRLSGVLKIFIISGIFTVIADIILLQWMGTRGIGYGAAIGALLNALLLLNMYRIQIKPNISFFLKEIRQYVIVLFFPILLLPILLGLWSILSLSSTLYTLMFVLFASCIFILLHLYALYRYWPELIAAATAIIRKGE